MRELKFRAWNEELKRIISFEDLSEFPLSALKSDNVWTFEQYTCLKDKNGKEIYEGDIVKWSYYVTTIYRDEKRYGNITVGWYYGENDFYPYSTDSGFSLPQSEDGYEIIGNVHENPELLEEE